MRRRDTVDLKYVEETKEPSSVPARPAKQDNTKCYVTKEREFLSYVAEYRLATGRAVS